MLYKHHHCLSTHPPYHPPITSSVRAVAPWAVNCDDSPAVPMYSRRLIRWARHVVASSIPVPWDL